MTKIEEIAHWINANTVEDIRICSDDEAWSKYDNSYFNEEELLIFAKRLGYNKNS